jgi:hypothetical protein
VIDRLGNPEPFFRESLTLGERPQLGMALGEAASGVHSGQDNLAKALAALRPVKEHYDLPETVYCPMIVALELVGLAEELIRQRVQDTIPAGRGEREGALGGRDGMVMCAHEEEMDAQKDRDLSQPTLIVQGRGEGLRLAQTCQDAPMITRRNER